MKKLLVFLVVIVIALGVVYFYNKGADSVVTDDSSTVVTDGAVTDETDVSDVEEETTEEEEALQADIDKLFALPEDEDATQEDCAVIENEEIRKSCEQGFIYTEAVTNADKNMCATLEDTGDQERCIAEIDAAAVTE